MSTPVRDCRRLQNSGVDEADPRESMRNLPGALQLPLTFLTGSAHRGQKALHLPATAHLAAALSNMVLGVALTAMLLSAGPVWLLALPLSWALTLHGMRNTRMMIYHQSAHRSLWGHRVPDAMVGRFCAALLLVQSFERYRQEHVADHHSRHHMTLRDPTVQAILISLALRPGMSRDEMWRRLIGRLVSPVFHARFALARIRSLLHSTDRIEQALAVVLYGTVIGFTAWSDAWAVLLVGWLFPLFPLYQVSNTLRLCVKHTFPAAGADSTGRQRLSSTTNAIFLGEPIPTPGTGARPWVRWWLRMLLVYFPSRYLVLTGDTPVHDLHHRFPRRSDWTDYLFLRQGDVDAGHPGWPPYQEVWGLVAAIDVMFASLARADSVAYDARLISTVSNRELFAAFDD